MGSNLEGRLLSDPTNKFHWCFVDDITLTITMLAYPDFCPLSNLKLGIKSCFSVLINKKYICNFGFSGLILSHTGLVETHVLVDAEIASAQGCSWVSPAWMFSACTAMVPHVPQMQILYGASTIAPIQAIPKRKHMSDSLASGNM